MGIEDVLAMAVEERKGKLEAERMLTQLQANYLNLQKEHADAKSTIDKLR